ncbi:hypothetical protein GCM10010116_01750 [Microbispora rosea subsp. aerata]|nr:DUF559 domain-containing protein [Microbispora rosea]GGO01019.1 hypothetical protein GCM10010116_01750 [Microbispora rosea subsp. aerata]GIH56423.1 hypothetical protein Mro02_33370 [Microbispora rosea subsp. aerata]GLJ84411.1 hypothetical protein GCM10017588_31390 [Microbispora rosea subsp. aerata]
MARSWKELPTGRVVHLSGDPDAIALSAEALPGDAPALVTYVPRPARTPADAVADVLRELEAAALAMFPAWLPEADGITGTGVASVLAVRARALRTGSTTRHFAPFLAHLAERALRERAAPGDVTAGGTTGRAGTFPPEIRAAGLARVLRSGYRRAEAAILMRMPPALPPYAEEVLVAAGEWLAHHGGFGVWLTGPAPRSVDRIETVTAPIPEEVAALVRETARAESAASGGSAPSGHSLGDPEPGHPAPDRLRGERGHASGDPESGGFDQGPMPVLAYPPLAGLPHPGSTAERRLEAALSACAWAAGREWNQFHTSGPLSNPIRVDLLWRAERCVVEIDGPEHLSPLRRAADRQRDERLRRDGYAVRRFTNEQVLKRLGTVLAELERFLHQCRNGTFEGSPHD